MPKLIAPKTKNSRIKIIFFDTAIFKNVKRIKLNKYVTNSQEIGLVKIALNVTLKVESNYLKYIQILFLQQRA